MIRIGDAGHSSYRGAIFRTAREDGAQLHQSLSDSVNFDVMHISTMSRMSHMS